MNNTPTVEPTNQAQRVFAKFGGVPSLHKALKRLPEARRRSISSIYRWNLPKANGGTGGIVPSSAMDDVQAAARLEGVVLTPADLYPGNR